MASYSDIKQHISTAERAKWNKVIADFNAHKGSNGTENHALATGPTGPAGFSQCDFTPRLLDKLNGIAEGALNNPHPATHPYTMITGLADIAHTGSWNDLRDIPSRVQQVINNTYDSATVSGGIRITIGGTSPSSPKNDKEIWIDTTNTVLKFYHGGAWVIIGAAYR